MLTLEHLRKVDPKLKNLTDEELERVRAKLYELGQYAFDKWLKKRNEPKAVPTYPFGLMPYLSGKCTM